MERPDFKKAVANTFLAFHLATSPVQAQPESEQLEKDLIICTAEDIRQRHGINVVDQYDETLSARFEAYSPMYKDISNLEVTSDLLCSIDETLSHLPNPHLYIQNIVFFKPLGALELLLGKYFSDPEFGEDSWIMLKFDQDIPLDNYHPHLPDNINPPDHRTLIQQIMGHEAGHALLDTITFLASEDEQVYRNRIGARYFLDEENPIFTIFARVSGFEYHKPRYLCEMDICELQVNDTNFVINGKPLSIRQNGWTRTQEFLERGQISVYEQTSNNIHEAFSEYLRAYIFAPGLLDENQLRFFDNLFEGLRSVEPYQFLSFLIEEPEKALLK